MESLKVPTPIKLKSNVSLNTVFKAEYGELDSTNEEAKRLFSTLSDGLKHLVVTAQVQSEGKGQYGRVWQSGKGGLYYTYLRPWSTAIDEKNLPGNVAKLVCQVIQETAFVTAEVEWPNDIIVEGKKVGGVLIERVAQGETTKAIVIGIGLNVNQEHFSAPVTHSAISLRQAAGTEFDIKQLADSLTEKLYAMDFSSDAVS